MLSLKQCLVFVVFYFGICSTCTIDKNEEYIVKCTSIKELKNADPEWTNLTLVNVKTQETLPNDAFKNLPNLKKLNITGAVNKIEPFAFRGLDKLETLHFEYNDIEELPDLSFLKELTHILVTYTKIKSIPENYFSKMTKLKYMMISHNPITTIGNCAFCDLDNVFVILYNNSLKTFEPIRVLGSPSFIAGINLDENQLTTVQPFGKMPNFVGATYVNNSITKIESNSFARAPKLMLIDVSYNQVEEIAVDIFPEHIRSDEPFFLVLHNNKIQCLSKEVRNKFRNLRRVTVSDNPWKCECLNEVTHWALGLKAFIGCDLKNSCVVSCVDEQNKKIDVKFY